LELGGFSDALWKRTYQSLEIIVADPRQAAELTGTQFTALDEGIDRRTTATKAVRRFLRGVKNLGGGKAFGAHRVSPSENQWTDENTPERQAHSA
jgi:hypothetical protein